MASVVINSEIFEQARVVIVFGAKPVEEVNGFAGRFEKAKRLWFQTEMQFASRLIAEARDVFDALKNIIANRPNLIRRFDKLFERTRNCADAAFNPARHELRKQIEKPIRVSEPFRGSPIG